jgi:hypothetical protein
MSVLQSSRDIVNLYLNHKIVIVSILLGCGGSGNATPDPVFPMDYATTYQEVRNCRFSLEHDLIYIRVLASPDALGPYTDRTTPFPTGAVLLKEQYGNEDQTCSGPIVTFTAMQKLDVGTSAPTLDWFWQDLKADFSPVKTDVMRCPACHKDCGNPPEGYDGTCTMP